MRRGDLVGLFILAAAAVGIATYLLGLLLLPAFMFLGAAVAVIGAIDAALKPDSAWTAADQNKIVWVGLQIGGLAIFGVPGFLAALAYFGLVRPKLRTHSTVV